MYAPGLLLPTTCLRTRQFTDTSGYASPCHSVQVVPENKYMFQKAQQQGRANHQYRVSGKKRWISIIPPAVKRMSPENRFTLRESHALMSSDSTTGVM